MAINVDGTTNMTDVSMCESITGWAGGIDQLALDTGVYIQGSGSLSAWINATTSATEYYTITTVDMSGGDHIYMWMMCTGVVDTQSNGGYRIVLYTDASNYATFYVGGNDTHGTGWQLMCCDASATPDLETGTFDPSDVTRVGLAFKTLTAAIVKGKEYVNNCYWDAVRYGTGLIITSGTTDNITFEGIYAVDNSGTYKYGVVQKSAGAYIITGGLTFGSTGGSLHIDFNDSSQVLLYPENDYIGSSFNTIEILGHSSTTSNFEIGGCFVKATGTQAILDLDGTNLNTINILGTSFVNTKCVFIASQTVQNCVFSGCSQVEPGLSTFDNNTIKETIATDAGLLFPSTSSVFSDCLFLDNTTGSGIEHDTATGTPFGYDALTFSGNTYDANNTSGSAIEVNKNNGSDPTTYTGSLVTFLGATVTTEITCVDVYAQTDIENVRVLVWVTDDTNFPFEASVNIASSGTTATVTHTDHGLITGDNVIIEGANEEEYNGVYSITYVSSSSYTYTMTESASSPATGTITSTFAFLNELTNSSGIASDTRIVDTDQPVTGWARKGTTTPLYQQSVITGTVDSATGLDLTLQMIPDE